MTSRAPSIVAAIVPTLFNGSLRTDATGPRPMEETISDAARMRRRDGGGCPPRPAHERVPQGGGTRARRRGRVDPWDRGGLPLRGPRARGGPRARRHRSPEGGWGGGARAPRGGPAGHGPP